MSAYICEAEQETNKNSTIVTGTRYIEKKTSLYLLCDDYVLSIADGTSVSTFLCTPGA